jgi:hypothetical protein
MHRGAEEIAVDRLHARESERIVERRQSRGRKSFALHTQELPGSR